MLQGSREISIIDTGRGLLQMDEARKKTTRELQEESRALLEEGKRLKESLDRLGMIAHGKRIEFTRIKPAAPTVDITIFYDKLVEDLKQELEHIEKVLFGMADEVTERGGRRTLKSSGWNSKEQP